MSAVTTIFHEVISTKLWWTPTSIWSSLQHTRNK